MLGGGDLEFVRRKAKHSRQLVEDVVATIFFDALSRLRDTPDGER